MPPALFDVLDHCPQTKVWKTRPPEPDLAGLRDRALLLVGFFAALRRSELANLRVEEISAHDRGLVLTLPRSKTNQRGEEHELVVLPRAGRRAHCPVTAVQTWLDTAGITSGPVFRKISRGNRVLDRALHPESINDLVQAAVARVGLQGGPFSAHSLRAGFVTFAHLRGASDRAIAHQTRRTAPWPPSAPTSGWRRRGRTTPRPSWACRGQAQARNVASDATTRCTVMPSAGLIEIEPLDVVRELLAERLDKAGGDGLRSGGQPDRTDVDGRA
ncbi:MAG: hypothetical protein QOC68_4524 [Solirubrobacteraceae bacterium]|nr:hypothetical protein [Streptomyces sp.]MEA2136614.1 hypothetical protein [Solirubrobacteraceae bacterium]